LRQRRTHPAPSALAPALLPRSKSGRHRDFPGTIQAFACIGEDAPGRRVPASSDRMSAGGGHCERRAMFAWRGKVDFLREVRLRAAGRRARPRRPLRRRADVRERMGGSGSQAAAPRSAATAPRCRSRGHQPPVTLMWRATAGRFARRSMTKSWPFGFSSIASSMAALSAASEGPARSGSRRSTASS